MQKFLFKNHLSNPAMRAYSAAMKIEQIQEIIRRIQHEITCPKCSHEFSDRVVDIKSVEPGSVECSVRCDHCGARCIISAQIGKAVIPGKAVPPQPMRKSSPLSPDTVRGITDNLTQFKGKDIRKLFE